MKRTCTSSAAVFSTAALYLHIHVHVMYVVASRIVYFSHSKFNILLHKNIVGNDHKPSVNLAIHDTPFFGVNEPGMGGFAASSFRNCCICCSSCGPENCEESKKKCTLDPVNLDGVIILYIIRVHDNMYIIIGTLFDKLYPKVATGCDFSHNYLSEKVQ